MIVIWWKFCEPKTLHLDLYEEYIYFAYRFREQRSHLQGFV